MRKRRRLALVREGYHPPAPAEIRVLGEEFLAGAKLGNPYACFGANSPVSTTRLWQENWHTYSPVAALRRRRLFLSSTFSIWSARLRRSACGGESERPQERIAHTLKTGESLCEIKLPADSYHYWTRILDPDFGIGANFCIPACNLERGLWCI